jgi:RsiW-degrading membrane proteinase PrsW (M82 family)
MLGPTGRPTAAAPAGRAAAPSPAPSTAGPRSPAASAPVAPRSRPRFLYLLLPLTLVPLGFQTFAEQSDVEERVQRTLISHPELADKLKSVESEDDLFAALPDHRIEGAHLARDTWVHWIYALVAATVYFLLMRLLFEPGGSSAMHLLTVGAVTGTIGIISLLAFQWIAEFTQGFWLRGGSIIVVLFYIVKLIGFSYHAALDPENGFALSFLGFTCGVGLCEELTKILPVVFLVGNDNKLGWRAACLIGLASGVGFGVAEGIMYSSSYYNGVMSADIYLTRFISCVALHAVWTAAAAIQAVHNRAAFDSSEGTDWLFNLLWIIGVPAILHGLYDTLLKRDMSGLALVVAALSFAWLIWMIERARSGDPEATPSRLPRHSFAAGAR